MEAPMQHISTRALLSLFDKLYINGSTPKQGPATEVTSETFIF